MSRSASLFLSLLLVILAPAIVVGSVFASRAESNLTHQAAAGGPGGNASRSAACSPPAGWVSVQAQPGDSLARLAARSGTSIETLEAANCLSNEIQPGDLVYLPGTPSRSPTPCGPPADWVLRTVAQDEGLPELAQELDVSEAELRAANCLGPFTVVLNGVRLYAPPSPTPTPTATPRPTATNTVSATPTPPTVSTESATIQSP
jgi:LysM repeat protein